MSLTLIAVPLTLLVLGFPIFVVLLAGSAVVLIIFMNIPLTLLHQVLFGSIDKYALLAVPFFIFAGELMGRGGIAQRIVDWLLAAIGSMRGSLGVATVGAATLMGAMSGSSPATVAAVGRLLYPALRENGYPEGFAAGTITSAGSIAIIVPPSIAMIIYAAAAEQSVPRLFAAGILPGLVITAVMALVILAYARRHGIRERRHFDVSQLIVATWRGAWAFGAPVIILGGIYSGLFSPTEAAGVACVYAAIVTRLIYAEITWRELVTIAADSAMLTSQILIIVACAGLFSWILTVNQVPQAIITALDSAALSPWLMLLAINLLLLLIGCVIDPLSAILVLTPLLRPIVEHLGIDMIHFGIIMTVNLSIGMFTPPFGLNLFVAQSIFRVPVKNLYRGLLPFVALQIAVLLVITYWPGLSLFVPSLLD